MRSARWSAPERRGRSVPATLPRALPVALRRTLDKTFSTNTLSTMKKLAILLLIQLAVFNPAEGQTNSTFSTGTPGQTVETIVCIRHGEKPPGGLGQLTCRGLNRALALPTVLLGKYGKPQFFFAPNPTQKVDGKNQDEYFYVRPLATIEPTAIRCGLAVNTQFGYEEIKGLETELRKPEYQDAKILIVWEHRLLDKFVQDLLETNGGNPSQVPRWPSQDYDTIFVVRITRSGPAKSVGFVVDHEGLDHLTENCP